MLLHSLLLLTNLEFEVVGKGDIKHIKAVVFPSTSVKTTLPSKML